MAGKVLYKHGRHPSRDGIGRASISHDAADKLKGAISKILERTISDTDFARLLDAVVLAKASSRPVGKNEMGEIMHRVTVQSGRASEEDIDLYILEAVPPPVAYDMIRRKDIEAQLRAMRKIRDDNSLTSALRACDHWTLSVINMASTDIMSDMLWERGEFTDADGQVCRTPRAINGGSATSPTVLPLGIDGLRQAIERAQSALDGDLAAGSDNFRDALARMPVLAKGRGPREKPYQSALADECITLWKKYGWPSQRKPWTTAGTDKRSGIVTFAKAIFVAAGMELSDRRLVTILKEARNSRAEKFWSNWHFIARLRKKAN